MTMEAHYVINIGRQLGSGGRAIGEKLAESLGVAYYDKELINLASQESGLCKEFFEKADEQTSSSFSRAIGMRFPFLNIESIPTNDLLSNDMLFKVQSDVIQKLAKDHSCIFVGRCADYILRDNPLCLNVFIHAPLEFRIAQMMKKQSLTEDKAISLIEKTDKKRASYYNYYTNKTWGMSSSYHLSLDSTVFGVEGTVDYIRQMVKKKFGV